MDILLVVVALIGAALGGLSLSQATMGVGFLAGACLLAILARMVQASHHHSRAMQVLEAHTRAISACQAAPVPAPPIIVQTETWLCFRCGQHVNGKFDTCTACGLARPGA